MKIFKYTTLLFIFLIALSACKKDHNLLGVDVQPENDGLNAVFCDTATITAFTLKYDSIASYSDYLKFLGSNQDPVFGRMDVGLYLNANIPDGVTSINFGNDANLVSAEIVLALNSYNFVGDPSTALTYSVFGLDSALNNLRLYYVYSPKLYNSNSVLAVNTASYSYINSQLVLRIPIDINYGKSILNNPQYLVDNSTFLNSYKGFYITSAGSPINPGTTPGSQGVIGKFNLEDPLSGFYLHYQHGSPSATKQTVDFKFNFSGTNAERFNTVHYQPNQSGNMYLQQQLSGDSILGQQNLFLKGLGGTRLKVKLPFLDYLKSYADSFPIAVNRAEFVFYIDPSFPASVGTGVYFAPPKLALIPLDSLGKETYAVDELTLVDFQRYDGNYDSLDNRYVFNLARHVQAIIDKKRKNYGFHMVVADPSGAILIRRDNYPERVVFGGSNNFNAAIRPKFNLSFIKYKHDKK